ncbi:hypothetical protein Bca52824_085697 [Brassica carinata]|uniref:Uncharacterized protein n=1 Tax=Brassica carinata TaxID=52824 RepID=A0A8X7PA36_BRACI|nr:hypothetical protein Bca52824_085697 [Brassica carinata]
MFESDFILEVPGLEVVIVVARFMKLTSDPDVHGMFGTLSEERHKHQGAAVINVGANAVSDTSRKSGYRLVGDVDFAQAS